MYFRNVINHCYIEDMSNDNEREGLNMNSETPISRFFGDQWIWNNEMNKIWNARNLTLRLLNLGHWNQVFPLVGSFITLSVSGKYSDEWRKWLWPNWGTIPAFVCRDWQKPGKSSIRIANVPAEIWIDHTLNTCLKHYH